jgi:iron uptake system component EfeO
MPPSRLRHAASPALVLVAAATLSGCGGSSSGVGSAGSDGSAGSVENIVNIAASDTTCKLDKRAFDAGTVHLAIKNTGNRVTEVYIYQGKRIITEKENIGPGTSYKLTSSLKAGSYQVACKPGMVGDGIRTVIKVTGAGGTNVNPRAAKAVTEYRAYVQSQVDTYMPVVDEFVAAVKAGDVAKAKSTFARSRFGWESIEPVAESFGDLDPRVDLREADLESGQKWTGWHRIEKELWVKNSTKGMEPFATQLAANVRELQTKVPTAHMSVTSIGNGAKELLDEVATGKISGEEDIFSHTDLSDFQANVDGAKKAFEVLKPLIVDNALVTTLDTEFANVQTALDKYKKGGGFVSYDAVDKAGRLELSRVVDALSEPLSNLTAAATG